MKTKTPDYILPDDTPLPFMEEAGQLADKIRDELRVAILTDSISITEMAGLLGMGASLQDYADGKLKGLVGHSFMRTLAEKKTPMPIARTENVTYLNIKEGIAEMINKNPEALAKTNAIADEQRRIIQKRLQTDNLLMLKKADVDKIANDEPEEIKRLRSAEGTSAVSSSSFRTAGGEG